MRKKRLIRWVIFTLGIIILTFGARIILLSDLGVGGLDAIAIGLAEHTGVSIGNVIIMLGIVLIIIAGCLKRKFTLLPIGTSLLVGWFYDLWGRLIFNQMESPVETEWIGYTFLLGLLIAPFGAAIYILSHVSMGPVDYLMMSVKERFHLSMQTGRIFIEITFVVIGYLVGGPIGVGTICIMLFWGPILQVYYGMLDKIAAKYVKRHSLDKRFLQK